MTIDELIEQSYGNALTKGFWDGCPPKPEEQFEWITARIMLVVTELAEGVEGLRHNDFDNFREELADAVIRIADLCGGLGIDLDHEIATKAAVNADRPRLHGKRF